MRLVAISTGWPSSCSRSVPPSTSQFWSAVFENPMPGSTAIRSGSTPAATRRVELLAQLGDHVGDHVAVRRVPLHSTECARQCISTYGVPSRATSGSISSSARPPETSLTSTAPAATAASATEARMVSTETATPSAASARPTGSTRSSSSCGLRPRRPRPGRLAADVDQVGPVGDAAAARA